MHVALLRRGRSKAGAQTTVTLAKGKWEAFTVAGALHAGDRIEALAAADAATGVPSAQGDARGDGQAAARGGGPPRLTDLPAAAFDTAYRPGYPS